MPKVKSVFIAYRHTGEDPVILRLMLIGVVDTLSKIGVNSYCTLFNQEEFDSKSMSARKIMEHAFEEIENRDALIVIQASNNKSEGMLMEVGRFYGSKPIIVAKHKKVLKTYLPDMADVSFIWDNQKELNSMHAGAIKQIEN